MRTLASLLGALAVGCGGGAGLGVGGSGSSGFDEAFVISAVLDEGTCQDGDGTDYCPTNVDDPSGGGQTVDAGVPEAEPVDCTAAAGATVGVDDGVLQIDGAVTAESCGFDVPVVPEGFEGGTTIHVAVRVTGGGEKWKISEIEYDGTAEFTAEVQVDPPADVPGSGEFEVQVAILTFDAGAADPPDEVETLSESGARSVYVTREVRVVTDPEPTPGATPSPTPEPTATARPTDEPTPQSTATDGPRETPTPAASVVPATPTPVRTVRATPTPARTVGPTPSPVRTVQRPTPTPLRTAEPPRLTAAPSTPRPTAEPKPTDAPKPTDRPRPTKTPDVRPVPTAIIDHRPTPTPRGSDVPRPTQEPEPEPTAKRPVFTDPRPTAQPDDRDPGRVPTD